MSLKVMVCPVGPVMTNCYICQNTQSQEIFVVDPGDEPQGLLEVIDSLNGELKGILLTHGHFDHIYGVPGILEEKKVPVYAMEAELPLLQDPAMNMTEREGRPLTVTPDILLQDMERFTLCGYRFLALLTPGHTPGGGCYFVGQEKILFSGDTLFHSSVGRTDYPGGSMAEIKKSVKRLYKQLPEETIVYPGHEQDTFLGYEMRHNFYVRHSDFI